MIIMSQRYIILPRYREVFSFTIAELATSSKHSLKYWHSELVKTLTAGGVDEKFCTKLMCQYNNSMGIGKLVTDVLSLYIQTQQPKLLKFIFPDYVACPTAQLQQLLREVHKHHKQEVSLEMCHSFLNYIACDDSIEVLAGAR